METRKEAAAGTQVREDGSWSRRAAIEVRKGPPYSE